MKKDNLVIIFAFASSILVFFLTIPTLSLNYNYDVLMRMLSVILFSVGFLMVCWKIVRLIIGYAVKNSF